MNSPFDEFDQAVTDLSWYFNEAESRMGLHGQSVDGDSGGKRVFDDEASWRMMASMCDEDRIKAIVKLRRIDATLRMCPEHMGTFRLTFVSFGRVSKTIVDAFTIGRVRLLGLAMASEAARTEYSASKSGSIYDWLDGQAKSLKSWNSYDRMRLAAQNRLLPALRAYAEHSKAVHDIARDAENKRIRDLQMKARASSPTAEAPEARVARLLVDTLRLSREAGYE